MPIYLKDYKIPYFLIEKVQLYFDLYEQHTLVKADLHIKRNGQHKKALVLNGEELDLLAVFLDDEPVDYKQDKEHLTINNVPDDFRLQTKVKIKPQKNTQLEGLYKSKNIFCTQCESHGFRRITYFLDRPDVMSRFTTTICASKKNYPVLLSNGNLIAKGTAKNHRHWVIWQDPLLKPAYLFALVAGNLEHISDKFITKSGRKVALKVYVEKGYKKQCWHALRSLQKAMQWDEQVFGREYDLDIYMIVAISDFNMGAMENKGLNIFNNKYVLADRQTATDEDYINIEHVVAHEYFHNWTGNRVTCRDWFQLSLKEGLTMFRDQLFSETFHPAVRIKNIDMVRSLQFPEDASPIAHPVRPKSYISMNNFYTVTVYNKGAEIIRMLHTILGAKKFRKGMDLYFKRHDGHAVTIDDFVQALQDASQIDLSKFKKWYDKSGTPVLDVKSEYNAKNKNFTLTVKQNRDFHIPLAISLVDKKGKNTKTTVLNIKNKIETFKFKNINTQPVLSLLRNFSAPVKLNYSYTNEDLMFLMQHDEDNFSRWNAAQSLAVNIILSLISDYQNNKELSLDAGFIKAFKNILHDNKLDKTFITLMLTLPNTAYLIELMDVADINAIFYVCEFIKSKLAENLQQDLLNCYRRVKERSLKNLCLYYLMYLPEQRIIDFALHQFNNAKNMTDIIGSLRALVDIDVPERERALTSFYNKWQHEDLVINKWLELQAIAKLPNTLKNVKALLKHPAFNIKNPNKVYALIRTFSKNNQIQFHDKTGRGYKFVADQVLKIDKFNPQVAASIVGVFSNWRKFDKNRVQLIKKQLKRIKNEPSLSKNVHEIVSKSLEG
jgi:aminopeptidase N